jgi:hypothetical protein
MTKRVEYKNCFVYLQNKLFGACKTAQRPVKRTVAKSLPLEKPLFVTL